MRLIGTLGVIPVALIVVAVLARVSHRIESANAPAPREKTVTS